MDLFVVSFHKAHGRGGMEYVCEAENEADARRQFWAWIEQEEMEPFSHVIDEIRTYQKADAFVNSEDDD